MADQEVYVLPGDQHGEAIEQLEEARGALHCLEFFNDINVDLSGFDGPTHIKRMSLTCALIARQLQVVQAILIDAKTTDAFAAAELIKKAAAP